MNSAFRLPEPYSKFSVSLAAVGALITDASGQVLLVKPHHNPYWTFVGGMVDAGEAPHAGCAREIVEEIGLEMKVGRLLVADWAPPSQSRPLPIAYYLFDCGSLTDSAAIRLQESELDEFAFLPPLEAAARLAPNVTTRLPAALKARVDGQTAYLPNGG